MARSTAARLEPGTRPPLTWAERTGGILFFHATVLRRTWRGDVVSAFLTPVLFLAAMGIGVGTLVDTASGGIEGVAYLPWVVPGIVMSSAMQWAVNESTWPVLTFLKRNEMYAVMLTAPHRVGDVLRGHWLMIAARITWSAMVFIGVAALFGGVGSWWALLGVPIAVLTAMAFTAPLFAIAARLTRDEGFTTIFRIVITPLMLFSGTFFPIAALPVWLQPIPWVTPLWHGTALARSAFLGQPAPPWWWLHVGVLLAWIVIGYRLALRAFTDRLAA